MSVAGVERRGPARSTTRCGHRRVRHVGAVGEQAEDEEPAQHDQDDRLDPPLGDQQLSAVGNPPSPLLSPEDRGSRVSLTEPPGAQGEHFVEALQAVGLVGDHEHAAPRAGLAGELADAAPPPPPRPGAPPARRRSGSAPARAAVARRRCAGAGRRRPSRRARRPRVAGRRAATRATARARRAPARARGLPPSAPGRASSEVLGQRAGEQVRVLRAEADGRAQVVLGRARERRCLRASTSPATGSRKRTSSSASVVLPQPLGPRSATRPPGNEAQVGAVEHPWAEVAVAKAHAAQFEGAVQRQVQRARRDRPRPPAHGARPRCGPRRRRRRRCCAAAVPSGRTASKAAIESRITAASRTPASRPSRTAGIATTATAAAVRPVTAVVSPPARPPASASRRCMRARRGALAVGPPDPVVLAAGHRDLGGPARGLDDGRGQRGAIGGLPAPRGARRGPGHARHDEAGGEQARGEDGAGRRQP